MPRTPDEIRKRFQNKHLLDSLRKACANMCETNREETKSAIITILNELPDFYFDVKTTMKQRAEHLTYYTPAKAQAQFLGTLKSLINDFEKDFLNLPAQMPEKIKTPADTSNLKNIISDLGLQITESESIPSRPPSFEDIPDELHRNVKQMLQKEYPGGIYQHQASGIQSYLDGNDVCLATSTASGKTLVFAAAAADLLMQDPNALVIAMYPARALVQDQLSKWQQLGQQLGLIVGQIDGSVVMNQRHQILQQSSIVVMTPDVVHAWLMRELSETKTRLKNLKLLILDEAHVYTGVFGTNMAYLMRRIRAASGPHRIIAATATIGEPEEFLKKLTGRDGFHLIGDDLNGAPSGGKTIQLVNLRANANDRSVFLQALLRSIAIGYPGKFIAFSDSRVGVENIAGALRKHGVMPYRSGYEDSCRREIQNALNYGKLKGVISTSALEVGVDIHDIDLVVILNYPPTINAFRQRLGRAGRSNQPGECLIVDTHGLVSGSDGGLAAYLQKPAEVPHLYLGNKALEFGNALCAFDELSQLGLAEYATQAAWTIDRFPNLPSTFHSFLANELEPTLALPSELDAIKQEVTLGGASPQIPIPLRGAISGTDFKLRVQLGNNPADLEPGVLGYLTAVQRFREAYPGAIHQHLGSKYRVTRTRPGPEGWEIVLRPLQYPNAEASTSTEVSKFILPIYNEKRILKSSAEGFVAAVMVEIHERINGFTERGFFKAYDATSPYFKKPFGYVRRSCGVIWFLGEDCEDARILPLLADALTTTAGISAREIGFGKITQKSCPLFENCGTAFVIYDDTPGNFFLTDDLVRYWPEIMERAKSIASSTEQPQLEKITEILENLRSRFLHLQDGTANQPIRGIAEAIRSDENEWCLVIADGEKVFRRNDVDYVEQVVSRVFMTRTGLKYELEGIQGGIEETNIVPASVETKMEWCNANDLERRRPYEEGPDYLVLQDLRAFTPRGAFDLHHGNRYQMEPVTELMPGRQQVVRDPRIPGGIAFGLVEPTNGGWFRITSDSGSVASFQVDPAMGRLEWMATVSETPRGDVSKL
ncbi:MAG: hypothetical protein RLZZ505_981 [Verrucomicrobiota bacterium]